MGKIILTSTDTVPGREIREVLGVVQGNCVKARHIGKDLRAAGRSIIGGEMKYYAELLDESRRKATDQMISQAEGLHADAVVTVRYHTASIMGGAAEVLAYGTAVRLK